MKKKTLQYILASAAITALVTSCGNRQQAAPSGGAPASNPAIPASLIATSAPGGALGVVAARAAAKPGDPVVMRGKVGGKMKPISDTAAILVLADLDAIASCDQNPEDECTTPWDYCCEDPTTIAASTATVQVKDGGGSVLRASLRGVGDLKELSYLVVSGTVDAASTAAALIVNADKIYIEKP